MLTSLPFRVALLSTSDARFNPSLKAITRLLRAGHLGRFSNRSARCMTKSQIIFAVYEVFGAMPR